MSRRRRWDGYPRPEPRLERWVDDLGQDLRYAVRQLGRSAGFASLIVVTLAIGIGANVTMVGAIDRLLLRPPPEVRDPGRVARLVFVSPTPAGGTRAGTSSNYPAFLDLEREVSAFEAAAAYWTRTLPLGEGTDAVDVRASLVSPSFFSVFGVRPALGRVFTPADGFPRGEASGGPPLAVLGYGFWQRQFAGQRDVVGRTVRLGRLTYTIVGVAPRGFRGVEAEGPDVWLPITVTAEQESERLFLADRGAAWLSMIARLRRGASRAIAEQQATTVWRHYNAPPRSPDTLRRVVVASVIRGRGPDAPREVKVALWLGGVSALVLLIACANVANLLLGRAFSRRREIAVRLALGAGRGRLARQTLTEALLLAALGGIASLWLASLGGRLVQSLFVADLGGGGLLDLRLFVFTAAIALGTGALTSLAPLVQSASPDLGDALRVGATAGGGRTSRVRMALLGTQAALCMVLLVGAGLFAQSLRRVEGLDLGLDLDRTLMARVDLSRVALPKAELEATWAAMLERVHAVPGVARAALAEGDPYKTFRAVAPFTDATRHESWWDQAHEAAYMIGVGSGFFRTVGARSLEGRDFEATDVRGARRVAIINAPLARLLWPDGKAVGRCMWLFEKDRECTTVVGVLHGYWRRSILDRDILCVYVPMAQRDGIYGPARPGSMFVAVRGDPDAVVPHVRHAIQGVRPGLPPVSVTRMRDVADPELRPWRLSATMFSLFGGIALVIAVVGLYAVVAFAVAQRSTEIAVRVALGARGRHVLAVVAGDGLLAVVAGLTVGVAAALAARQWVGPLLFQTSPDDPGIITGVAALLLAVAVLASLIPTVRALRRNPAAVLRTD